MLLSFLLVTLYHNLNKSFTVRVKSFYLCEEKCYISLTTLIGATKRGERGEGTQTKCGFLLLADVWCSLSDRVDGERHRTKYIITETVDGSNSSQYQHAIVFHTSCNGEIAIQSLQQVFQIKRHVRRLGHQYRRTTTHGFTNEGIFWNCTQWRKCSSFQQQFSKHLMMTISVETYSAPVTWKIFLKFKNMNLRI
jgi:hypothetical protein